MVQVGVHGHYLTSKPAVGHRVLTVVVLPLLASTASILIGTKFKLNLVRVHVPHLAIRFCISSAEVGPKGFIGSIEITTFVTVVNDATQCCFQCCSLLTIGSLIVCA